MTFSPINNFIYIYIYIYIYTYILKRNAFWF